MDRQGTYSSGQAAYDTVRAPTVLPLHQIKTVERDMKIRRMVRITNTPGEDDGCRLNPDSSSGIYITSENEAQCRIVAENRRKQYEVKQNAKRSNYVRSSARIIKRGGSYKNILYIPLSSDTPQGCLFPYGWKYWRFSRRQEANGRVGDCKGVG